MSINVSNLYATQHIVVNINKSLLVVKVRTM